MSNEDSLMVARQKISDIDSKMAALFEERMRTASDIADYKKANNLPIYDADREKELINKNAQLLRDEELKDYYVEFLQDVIDISKKYQERLMKGSTK